MEEELKIDLPDGKKLYGILLSSRDDKKLVIFVHGLTGHKNEIQYINAAPVFAEAGFSSFRLDLYSSNEDARELLECTVDIHSEDLNVVLDYFKDKYQAIYLVGHSIGGPTIIYANHGHVKAMALWDPSFGIFENQHLYMKNEGDNYKLNWGDAFYVSSAFVESLKRVNELQIPHIDVPTVLIFGGGYRNKDRWKPYLGDIEAEHEVCIIKGANHQFDTPEHEQKLFQTTLKWFKKY